jgi:uncharacterized membrane-anchored protein YhcB (DUF1043 family)
MTALIGFLIGFICGVIFGWLGLATLQHQMGVRDE